MVTIVRNRWCRTRYSTMVACSLRARAVAPHPSLSQVRGGDLQRVPFPFAGGEALPRMGSPRRRVRTSIHVDHPVRQHPARRQVPRLDSLRQAVRVGPDAQVGGSARRVVRGVRLALVLHHHPFLGVPGVAPHAIFVIDGHTGVIADMRTRTSLGPVFLHLLPPLPRQFHLGAYRLRRKPRKTHQHESADKETGNSVSSRISLQTGAVHRPEF
jgi:hypothetical protein